jgi:uncharacterized protein DUF4129
LGEYDLRDMPGRISSRTAVAALLLALTIVGIGAAGPAVNTHTPPRGVVLVTAATLEAVLAGLLIALRWRAAPASGVGGRLRAILSGSLLTALIVLPFAAFLDVVGKVRWHRRTDEIGQSSRGRLVRPHGLRPTPRASFAVADHLLIGLLVAALLIAMILIWQRRRHLARLARRDAVVDEETDTPTDPARAAMAVDSGRRAMRDLDEARAAIIACYLAMEESMAEAGAARGAAETPDELLARVAHLVNTAAAASLTALFYEARFSAHPMSAEHRDAAERALAELAAILPEPAAEEAR